MKSNKWIEVQMDGRRQVFPVKNITEIIYRKTEEGSAIMEVYTQSVSRQDSGIAYRWLIDDVREAERIYCKIRDSFIGDVFMLTTPVTCIVEGESK